MRYNLKFGESTYTINDNLLFDEQDKLFKQKFSEIVDYDTATFDNAKVLLLHTGRIVITDKINE